MADQDGETQAEEEQNWDGNWSMAGHKGMFAKLRHEQTFLEEQLQTFNDEKEKSSLQMEQEFLNLEEVIQAGEDGLEENWAKLQQRQLHPRNLNLADAVARRAAEGTCPPRIRIRQIASNKMKELLDLKQKGNQAFGNKEYEKAVGLYDEALSCMEHDMYVAPKDQMEQIVAILSNQAECYLRLNKFMEAGTVATNALLFDNSHEKSRMRRAKAELAIAGAPYLVQALVDLEELVSEHYSSAGVKQAKELLPQVKEVIEMEKETMKRTKDATDEDWDMYVRTLRSRCW